MRGEGGFFLRLKGGALLWALAWVQASLLGGAAPLNDDFANAMEIAGEAAFFEGSFSGASQEESEPLGPEGLGRTVWHRWSALASGMYFFTNAGEEAPLLTIYRGESLPVLEAVKTNAVLWVDCYSVHSAPGTNGTPAVIHIPTADDRDGTSFATFWHSEDSLRISARSGEAFYFQTDATSEAMPPEFRFDIGFVRAPAHDDFANAMPLRGRVIVHTNSTAGATTEPGEPVHAARAGATVWYRWSSTATGTARISTNEPVVFGPPTATNFYSIFDNPGEGASGVVVTPVITAPNPDPFDCGYPLDPEIFYPVFALYEGTDLGGLKPLGAGTNFLAHVVEGREYYIAAGANRGMPGDFRMTVAFNHFPENDDFGSSIRLGGGHVKVTSHNLGTSAQAGEPAHAGMEPVGSIWWSWTAPATGPVAITNQSQNASWMAVYAGGALGELETVAETDEERLSFTAQRGVTYHIAVDSLAEDAGSAGLEIEMSAPVVKLAREIAREAGSFHFNVSGRAGERVSVQRSEDLRTWSELAQVELTADVIIAYVPLGPGEPMAFFRTIAMD